MATAAEVLAALAEPGRLAALRATELLDSPPDAEFDRLSQLAARVVRVPVALVTLVDGDRQFFKSCMGLPEPWQSWRQSPLTHSICQHVVGTGRPLALADVREDPVMHESLAIRDFGVVAYLGIPLLSEDGHALGSFCVIDRERREWSADEIWVMDTLAKSVVTEIQLRQHRGRLESLCDRRTKQLEGELKERQRVEEELRGALQKARVATEARERFLGVLGHELRTPLTPVMLYVSAMEGDPNLSEEMRETCRLIREQIELESRMIDDLLDVAAIVRGELAVRMREVDLHECVRGAVRVLAAEGRVGLELGARRSVVLGDPDRLRQVFEKVIGNALRFSPEGSLVTVRSADEVGEGGMGWVRVEVEDRGVGLEAGVIPRIFEPFEQAKPATLREFGGLGLGLSIAKAVVEMHGGTVEVRSEGKGKGTVVGVKMGVAGGKKGGK